jgi:exodeoxyribonuclease VII small subunit
VEIPVSTRKKSAETEEAPPTLAAVQDELESIIERLEDDDTALEESIALYEKGAKLLARAQDVLANAEQRVRMLTEASDDSDTESTDT